jgi:hypothetical protein
MQLTKWYDPNATSNPRPNSFASGTGQRKGWQVEAPAAEPDGASHPS